MGSILAGMPSLPSGFNAIVVGASGGIGSAVADQLVKMDQCRTVEQISRTNVPDFDICNESSIAALSHNLRKNLETAHLIFDATGLLNIAGVGPEKSITKLDPDVMARAFTVNAIGPALLMKHLLPLLPVEHKGVFASLSARVGSIQDNSLGGWYSYRASKAALNQIVRTMAIEVSRKRPKSVCLALHPGTVETPLSQPFAKGRFTHSPNQAAMGLLKVIDQTGAEKTGTFLDYAGNEIPW